MIDDSDLLENFSKDMKDSTLSNYMVRLRRFQEITGGKELYYIMTNPKRCYKKLKETFSDENATRANYITQITKLYTRNGEMLKDHSKEYNIWKDYLKKERDEVVFRYKLNKPTEKQEQNLVSYEDVRKKYEELRKNKSVYEDPKTNLHMVLFGVLINLRPKRADLGNVRILKKAPKDQTAYNYIVLDKSPRLVLNIHKTADKNHAIIEDINSELYEILLNSLKHYPRKHLFVNRDTKPYEDNRAYSHFVRRMFKKYFGKETGVSLWRHIHVTERINPLTMNEHELEREAKLMGHSVAQQRIVYRWVNKNQICETTCKPEGD